MRRYCRQHDIELSNLSFGVHFFSLFTENEQGCVGNVIFILERSRLVNGTETA
jgi:hypothetical protein